MAQSPLRNLILLPAVATDVATDPLLRDLVFSDPVFSDPLFSDPAFRDPAFSDPLFSDPALHDPAFSDPAFGDPVLRDPLFDSGNPLVLGLGDNPQDFAALFVRHRWSFALHARRFLSDQRDIDEVVQEGFLRLFQILPELETELQALAYCRRTITNLCIDRYRADLRRPRLIELHNMSLHLIIDEDENDPLIQAEDAAAVRDALAQLSPLHRSALIRREIQEQSLTQIAAEMDIPLAQVKHLLFRARGSLRRLLVGTQVEPGVDLELAMALAAHRSQHEAVQRPPGG